MTSSGLALIGSYSDDDEESNESDCLPPKNVDTETYLCPVKKCRTDKDSSTIVSPSHLKRLPLPSTIVQLFNKRDTNEPPEDDPSLHDGRVRSFPHKRGNWSTYVYLSYAQEDGLDDLLERLVKCAACADLQLKPITELHISLTRTVVLLHHWIDNFVRSIKVKLSHTPRFAVQLGAPEVYCNEEKTRTFLGLKVVYGAAELTAAARALDHCLEEFRLPPFYQDPSFHMSVLWMVGDAKAELEAILPRLHQEFHACVAEHNLHLGIDVTHCFCKTGNKLFSFPLAS